MSIWNKIKKGVKKGKKAFKKGAKAIEHGEKVLGKGFDKYNRHIESKIRGRVTKVMPKDLRKGGIKAGKFMSGTVERIHNSARKLARKAGVTPAWDMARHFSPLGDLETAGDVLQGKTSLLEAGFDLETGYSRGMFKDYIKFEKWKGNKLRIPKLTTGAHHAHKITVPERKITLPHVKPEIGGPIGIAKNKISNPSSNKTPPSGPISVN